MPKTYAPITRTVTPGRTSSQVTGAGTEYTLTGSYARVDFGTTDAQVTLSTAGTYLVTAIIGIANDSIYSISAAVHFKFYNSTDSADVSNSERKQNIQAAVANGQIVLQNLITVNGSKTIQIYGTSPTASADVDVIAAETSISFVKLAV